MLYLMLLKRFSSASSAIVIEGLSVETGFDDSRDVENLQGVA